MSFENGLSGRKSLNQLFNNIKKNRLSYYVWSDTIFLLNVILTSFV